MSATHADLEDVALECGTVILRPIDALDLVREHSDAVAALVAAGARVDAVGAYFVVRTDTALCVRDRFGDDVIAIEGERAEAESLHETIERLTRYRGPVTLRPTVWIIDGSRLIELTAVGTNMAPYAGRDDVTYLVGRQRS